MLDHRMDHGERIEALQWQLVDLKIEYEATAEERRRDSFFAEQEAEIGEQFRALGVAPSYPPGWLEQRSRAAGQAAAAAFQAREGAP